jgi:hypothetical protein
MQLLGFIYLCIPNPCHLWCLVRPVVAQMKNESNDSGITDGRGKLYLYCLLPRVGNFSSISADCVVNCNPNSPGSA